MTTYTDEVNVYNPNAIGDAIDDAALTADNYLTDITGGGVMVHPSGDSTSGWRIASALELIKGGITYIKAWLNGNNNTPTVTIGDTTSGNYALIDDDSFDINHGNTQMVHFGYGEGEGESGVETAPYYTLGRRVITDRVYDSTRTYDVGDHVLYDSIAYVCKVGITTPEEWNSSHWQRAFGNWSVAEGLSTASGPWSHSEGLSAANGHYSHAENSSNQANGHDSHAEGTWTTANGISSHTEGEFTIANGTHSHAEGYECQSNGNYSHAQNKGTIARREAQTVLGKYNKTDANDYAYAVIVGNGTSNSARSNALAVRWEGDVDLGNSGVHAISSTSELHLLPNRDTATQYRMCFTNAGNIRLEKSTDYGSTWTTDQYFMRGRNAAPSVTTTVANVLTAVSGVSSITNVNAAIYGRICMLHVTIKLTAAHSAGNVANEAIATMKPDYYPLFAAVLTSSGTGPLASGYISTDHKLYLAALGSAVSAGGEISLGGTFFLDS